jgi:hypothetical protein
MMGETGAYIGGPWHWTAATIETIRTTLRYLGRAPPARTVLLHGLLLI